jgi:hypothetical protein
MQDYLFLTQDNKVCVRGPQDKDQGPEALECLAREASREAELAAFRGCRFQRGNASEGRLCNEPPIPLRVLDFLEARDLLSMSLVCKSTHQAAHLLFEWEVRPLVLILQQLCYVKQVGEACSSVVHCKIVP